MALHPYLFFSNMTACAATTDYRGILGGSVQMSLGETFRSSLFGSCVDRLGAGWMVNVATGLVDEYRLLIEPVLLGGGKTIFPTDGECRPLELASAATTPTGVLLCVYRPATDESD